MNPVVTWIVLANTREARVLANRGPGSGLVSLAGRRWTAQEVARLRDKNGAGRSLAAPAISAVVQTDGHRRSGALFARTVMGKLSNSLEAKKLDRLVLVAGPLMLGLMRMAMDPQLKQVLIDEIDRDFSALPVDALETHLGEVMAV